MEALGATRGLGNGALIRITQLLTHLVHIQHTPSKKMTILCTEFSNSNPKIAQATLAHFSRYSQWIYFCL